MVKFSQQQLEELVTRIQSGGVAALGATEVVGLIFGYGSVVAERDALAAELAQVRAGLPKWKPVHNKLSDGSPSFLCLKLAYFTLRTLHLPATEAECAAACAEFGLPPCEVEGE